MGWFIAAAGLWGVRGILVGGRSSLSHYVAAGTAWLALFLLCYLSTRSHYFRGDLVGLLVLTIALTLACLVKLGRQLWMRQFSSALAPLSVACLMMSVFLARGQIIDWLDAIHIAIAPPSFEAGQNYNVGTKAVRFLGWGELPGFAGSTDVLFTLAYDETDEIRKPDQERSALWQKVASKAFDSHAGKSHDIIGWDPMTARTTHQKSEACSAQVDHLLGH